MKQPSDSVFFQSQLYVAELSESIGLFEFIEPSQQIQKQGSGKLEPVKLMDQSSKMNKPQKPIIMPKPNNPYKSDWASNVLKDQFKVELTQVSQRYGTKWIVKKLKENESNEERPSDAKIIRELKSQEVLFRNTASKSNRKRLNKFIKDFRGEYNGSNILPEKPKQNPKLSLESELLHLMPIFDINFQSRFDNNVI